MSAPDYMKQGPGDYGSGADNRKRTDPTQREIIDNWESVETIAESCDPWADYSFDDYALLRLGDVYYITNASGCSCPSPSEVWGVVKRGTRAEVEAMLRENVDETYSGEAWREFQRAVAKAGWDVPAPEPRPQGSDW